MADPVEVPEISDAYSLAPLLRVEILGTEPLKPVSKQRFRLNVLIGLKHQHLVDAEILRNYFKELGEKYSTNLEVAFLNGSHAPVIKQSKRLCFADLPEVFSEKGYVQSEDNIVLQTVGSYRIIARVADSQSPEGLVEGGRNVISAGLEVIAGKLTAGPIQMPAPTKPYHNPGIAVPSSQKIRISGPAYQAAIKSAAEAARKH